MSSKLKPLDLTGAIVGTFGKIDFNQFVKFNPVPGLPKAHIWLYNESGCGLDLVFQASGNAHYLPAGGWGTFDLEPNDGSVQATVTYTLPNPPVSTLNAIYYAPNEVVPPAFTLGNSPIGIGGSVNTTGVQTLSNEGTGSGLLVMDMGDTTFSQIVTFYNDGHCTWAVDQSGVSHQVIKVQTSGNPLQLGKSGDVTEVLGNLTVDGTSILTGVLTAAAANLFGAVGVLTHILGTLTVDQSISTDSTKITTDGSGTVQLSKASTAINGSIGGDVQFFSPVWGASLKIFKSANAISFTLPSAIARGWIFIGNQGGAAVASHFEASSVAVNVRLVTTLGGTAAGATVQQSNMFQDSIASIISTVDTWKMAATAGATSSAIVCIGA